MCLVCERVRVSERCGRCVGGALLHARMCCAAACGVVCTSVLQDAQVIREVKAWLSAQGSKIKVCVCVNVRMGVC